MSLTHFLIWSVLVVLIPTAAFIPVGHTDCQLSRCQFHAHATPEINDDVDPFVKAKEQHQRNIIVLCSNVSQDVVNGIFDVNNLPKGRLDVLARCIASSLWISNEIRADTNVFLMLGKHNVTVEVRGSSVRSLTPDERTIALYLQRSLWNGGIDKNELIGGQVLDVPTSSISTPQAQGTSMNPQSTPMSDEKRIRDMKKGREAMINRINITHYGKSPLPGFILHQNDTLQDRLEQLITSASAYNDAASAIYMLNENGDPLWDVLEAAAKVKHARKMNNDVQSTTDSKPITITTLILGNQLGYSEDDEELLLGTPEVQEVSLGSLSLLTSQCITITHHYLDRFEQFEHTRV